MALTRLMSKVLTHLSGYLIVLILTLALYDTTDAVPAAPTVILSEESTTGGTHITLKCQYAEITGTPLASITWSYKGDEFLRYTTVNQANSILLASYHGRLEDFTYDADAYYHQMKLRSVHPCRDAGSYQCSLQDGVDDVSSDGKMLYINGGEATLEIRWADDTCISCETKNHVVPVGSVTLKCVLSHVSVGASDASLTIVSEATMGDATTTSEEDLLTCLYTVTTERSVTFAATDTFDFNCTATWPVSENKFAGIAHIDVDECNSGDSDSNTCTDNAICVNADDGHTCECPTGYTLDDTGLACTDIDECNIETPHNCSHNCHNFEGTYNCSCDTGYTLNADLHKCDDIDECAEDSLNECDHICHNQPSTYNCSCRSGYILDDDTHSCNDINECDEDTDGCEFDCKNTVGSFECLCDDGYQLKADNKTCEDIDECTDESHTCAHICHNQAGQYFCSCREGYSLDEDGITCNDIDECADDTDECEHLCNNTVGSFTCLCPDGYQLKSDKHKCTATHTHGPYFHARIKVDKAFESSMNSDSQKQNSEEKACPEFEKVQWYKDCEIPEVMAEDDTTTVVLLLHAKDDLEAPDQEQAGQLLRNLTSKWGGWPFGNGVVLPLIAKNPLVVVGENSQEVPNNGACFWYDHLKQCKNGALCYENNTTSSPFCRCTYGWTGPYCEVEDEVKKSTISVGAIIGIVVGVIVLLVLLVTLILCIVRREEDSMEYNRHHDDGRSNSHRRHNHHHSGFHDSTSHIIPTRYDNWGTYRNSFGNNYFRKPTYGYQDSEFSDNNYSWARR